MSEKLNFAIDGEFLTNIARDWFWNMNKSYKKCEELLLSCMAGGSEEEKRHVCQDIIEGRKKLVGINEFELVDDNGKVRPLGQKVEELQRKMLVNQVREDMIAHPLKYLDRFAMPFDYDMFCRDFLSRQTTSRRKTRINIRSNSIPTHPSRSTMKKDRLLRLQITAMTALPNGLSSM